MLLLWTLFLSDKQRRQKTAGLIGRKLKYRVQAETLQFLSRDEVSLVLPRSPHISVLVRTETGSGPPGSCLANIRLVPQSSRPQHVPGRQDPH